jgi:hypothetical protein
MTQTQRLRERAAWYRKFAEKTENPWIWAARVRVAEALEAEAWLIERDDVPQTERPHPGAIAQSEER